jgi:hypothetical protein
VLEVRAGALPVTLRRDHAAFAAYAQQLRARSEGTAFAQLPGLAETLDATMAFTSRIDTLLGQIQQRGENADNVQEIMALATQWNIVTPYTSYLTTEPGYNGVAGNVPVAPPGQPRPMSVVRPDFADEEIDGDMRATGMAGAPAEPSPTPSGFGSGRGGGGVARDNNDPSSASPSWNQGAAVQGYGQPAPAPPASAPRREVRAEVGQAAVEDSIAWNERARSQTVTDSTNNVRAVVGRSFTNLQGVWMEAGTESRSVDVTLAPFSDAYFRLLSENPELADIFALGTIVRFQLDSRVYEVRP